MKSTLFVLLATLSGAAAVVLPAGHAKQRDPEFNSFSSSSDSSAENLVSYSTSVHRLGERNFNDPKETRAFALRQADQLLLKHGNGTRSAKRRDARLYKRQRTGLIDSKGDSNYYAQVSFGSPAQNLLVQLDTGSSDLMVFGTACEDSCDGSNKFDPSRSSTYAASNTTFDSTSGTEGKLAADTVSFAGYRTHQQSFVVIDELEDSLVEQSASGIMGLSFGSTAQTGTPFWEVLTRSGKLPWPLFTLQLSRQKNNPALLHGQAEDRQLLPGGILTFGAIDPKQYSGEITYTSVTSDTAWQLPLDSFTLSGQKTTLPAPLKSAIFDSGTASIVGPSEVIAAIYAQILGAERDGSSDDERGLEHWSIPCAADVRISLSFGGRDWAISSTDLTVGRLESNQDEAARCMGSFLGATSDVNMPASWILGTTFLKNVFQVYDGNFGKGRPRIGLASLKGASGQSIATTQNAIPFPSSGSTNGEVAAPTPTRRPSASIPHAQITHATLGDGVRGAPGLPVPSVDPAMPQALPLIVAGNNYADPHKLDAMTTGITRAASNAATSAATYRGSAWHFAAFGVAAGLALLL